MAQKNATADEVVADTASAAALVPAAKALQQAAAALQQAAAALNGAATAGHGAGLLQGGQAAGGGAAAAVIGQQINIWEDDPFSEATATPNPAPSAPTVVTMPTLNAPFLGVRILDPQPPLTRHAPGTPGFRYWLAAEALVRGVGFWATLLPLGTRWSTMTPFLQVQLNVGRDLNAFYSRQAGLRFFSQTVRNVGVFSGESPDVVLHELGHAVLDALRPQLFHVASPEAAAFHESFGDMSGILGALQLPSLRARVLTETDGHLNVSSRLSRVAEQLGWGIRQLSPSAVDPDSLRNAANRFFYQHPATLPPSGPANQLSSAPHSFSRVFTGAFLDALARIFSARGDISESGLLTVSRVMGQLLVEGVRTAPITPAYFSSVAAAMIQADRALNGGRHVAALGNAFVQRGILSPGALGALASAPVPAVVPVPGAQDAASLGITTGASLSGGADTFVSYGDGVEDEAFLLAGPDVPDLPVRAVAADLGFAQAILAHTPDQAERFAGVAPAPPADCLSLTATGVMDDAAVFIEDLIQLGRIAAAPTASLVGGAEAVGLVAPDTVREDKTHELAPGGDGQGLLLRRRHFDCGFGCRH